MIFDSLVQYYDTLVSENKLPGPGYSYLDVRFALDIDINGNINGIIDLTKDKRPKKMVFPIRPVKSSNIIPSLLCDNAAYILGLSEKGRKYNEDRFLAEKKLHLEELAAAADEEAAVAVINYFNNWDIDKAESHPVVKDWSKTLMKGGNIVFFYNGKYVHDYDSVKTVLSNTVQKDKSESPKKLCCTTGQYDVIPAIHPKIKGIRGIGAFGAPIVTFDSEASESYGKKQGDNAQMGERAAHAYSEALNYLLEHLDFRHYIGDTAILFFAKSGEPVYDNAYCNFAFGGDFYEQKDLEGAVDNICKGLEAEIDNSKIDPSMKFCLMGLSPNIGRLSVKFYAERSFRDYLTNIKAHYDRQQIDDTRIRIEPWQILGEIYTKNEKVENSFAAELIRAIIEDTKYPFPLITKLDHRVSVEHDVSRRKAALIKAFYLKNESKYVPKEVLTMGLNTQTDNIPYNLGRLFAMLVQIQKSANPGTVINASIRDKFFTGMSNNPAVILPRLIELSQHHLKKMKLPLRIYYDKMLGEMMERFELGDIPKHLNLQERGAFQLGYYQQTQDFFKSKKNESEDTSEAENEKE